LVKIAYILLCHQDPEGVIRQTRQLAARGDYVAIHFDGRASAAQFDRIRTVLGDNESVVLAPRVKCGWGEWSLVEATLNAVSAAVAAFPDASHFYMISGDCMPIKSAEYMHDFLAQSEKDYVESFDYFKSDWIKTGLKEERLIYRHFINERKHKSLFYSAMNLQKRLGLKRAIPRDLTVMVGSQWWCLRRRTIRSILDFCAERPDVMRFFRGTWIPDETFFQTLVRHLVPHAEIDARTLTFLMFSDYGMPVTFHNDQYDLLVGQDYLFARKISRDALDLKNRLGDLYSSGQKTFDITDEGRRLYAYVTQQGRHGRRFGPRFWERDATIGRDRELLVLVCKKWDVAKRLLGAIKRQTNIPGVEYLFDEMEAGLPHLGGIEDSLQKRARHRRALMRLLYDYYDTERLVICVDPGNIAPIRDFYADRCTTRMLDIECEYDTDYLIDHAKRTGLAGETTPLDALQRLTVTIREELLHERDQMVDAHFPNYHHISDHHGDRDNATTLSRFLGVSDDMAMEIAATPDLFKG